MLQQHEVNPLTGKGHMNAVFMLGPDCWCHTEWSYWFGDYMLYLAIYHSGRRDVYMIETLGM